MARHSVSDFDPAAAALPRHFSSGCLCLLPVKCGLSRPSLQGAEKRRILLVPLEGIT